MDCGKDTSQVFTINKGTAQGTTFKIDTGGFAFSCLFDTGAEISYMNMDTVAALGLLGKLTRSSVTVNTASGQNMGVGGDVQVNFKIGRKYSFTQTFVVCENLTTPFILGADFMTKHYMKLGWAPCRKRTLGCLDKTIAVASQEVTNEPLVLRNSIRIPARNCAVVPVYCTQMLSGKVMVVLCNELKQQFPNIDMEPMQMDNTEGKSCDTIPYMIVNLDYNDPVYICKDRPIAYIHEEDVSCEYLEVNEIVESMQGINWVPLSKHKIVKSDLVYSPAQITEHWKVELKDHNASKETKQQSEELKAKYPEVFSINNEDIGHTQLVTMDIDMGDSPPVCQKPYTLPLKHYTWIQQEIETLEWAGVIKKSINLWASPIVVIPKKSAPGEPPRHRMCIDFRKLNELQPEVHHANSEIGGNISLVPLPKIDEMYGRL